MSNDISRRKVLGKLSTGVAAVAGSALTGQAAAQRLTAQRAPQTIKRNPVNQFPRPPFPKQSQPWPGLVSKMNPRPDHGETSYQGSGRLLGRKALITGGDSGIGRAVAIAYAREGADVAISYLPAEESDAREVVALIRAAGRKAVALPGDIRNEAFCNQMVDAAAQQLGGLDILVNNAGRQHAVAHIEDLTTELFDWTFKTNLYAMIWITKAALRHMDAGSAIITTSSVQGYDPSDNLLDYSQTKAAQVAFTKGLAKQLAPKGIRVNAVTPGPYWTVLQVTGGQPSDAIPQFGAQTPLGRPGQPVEIASVYVHLAGAEASYTTGQVYGSAGGSGNP